MCKIFAKSIRLFCRRCVSDRQTDKQTNKQTNLIPPITMSLYVFITKLQQRREFTVMITVNIQLLTTAAGKDILAVA